MRSAGPRQGSPASVFPPSSTLLLLLQLLKPLPLLLPFLLLQPACLLSLRPAQSFWGPPTECTAFVPPTGGGPFGGALSRSARPESAASQRLLIRPLEGSPGGPSRGLLARGALQKPTGGQRPWTSLPRDSEPPETFRYLLPLLKRACSVANLLPEGRLGPPPLEGLQQVRALASKVTEWERQQQQKEKLNAFLLGSRGQDEEEETAVAREELDELLQQILEIEEACVVRSLHAFLVLLLLLLLLPLLLLVLLAASLAAAAVVLAFLNAAADTAAAVAQEEVIWGGESGNENFAAVEIRAAAGGEEAELWAGDLFKMLQLYCQQVGWSVKERGPLEMLGSGSRVGSCDFIGDEGGRGAREGPSNTHGKVVCILKKKLQQQLDVQQQQQLREERLKQVAGGQRYEKIRTYNARDGRVSDHRLQQQKVFPYKQLLTEGKLHQLHALLLLQQATHALQQRVEAAEAAAANQRTSQGNGKSLLPIQR
ncbi:hypothetical protein Emag_005849 [Eimeria magna]